MTSRERDKGNRTEAVHFLQASSTLEQLSQMRTPNQRFSQELHDLAMSRGILV